MENEGKNIEEKDIKQMNIFEKMSNITNEISNVNKNLTVGQGKSSYKAVGEADVLKAVKELEFKYRVYSYPRDREVIESTMYTTTNEYGEKNNIFSRIKTFYRFVNIDRPEEFIETITFAEGIDTQDKGSGKAMTYSDKYALMKSYKIITGEDPDQHPSEEGYKKKQTKTTTQKTNTEIDNVDDKVTEQQAKTVYAVMTKKGLNVVELLEKNYNIKNTKDLTKRQYASILTKMKEIPDKE